MTLACLDEVMTTLLTFALAVAARPDPACALMTDANVDPFCSRATRCATGVLALKNFSQLAVIVAAAEPLAAALADVAGADVAGADVPDELAPELLLLPQAAMPTPSTPTSTRSWSVR